MGLLLLAVAPLLYGQAPVEESQPVRVGTPSAQTPPPMLGEGSERRGATAASTPATTTPPAEGPLIPEETPTQGATRSNAQLFYQLQLMQEEMRDLRGQVEELRFEVKRLKQQRLDDYMDLDRRISQLTGAKPSRPGTAGESASTPQAAAGNASTSAPATKGNAGEQDERGAYLEAYNLLKQRQLAQATSAFRALLQQYPEGDYAPNAHYWLGEIDLLEGRLDAAKTEFQTLIERFPNDRKAMDAKYKLARIHLQQGDKARAKVLLEEVAASGTEAARLAREDLQKQF